MNQTDFANLQQRLGFTFHTNSVLLEPTLCDIVRPVSQHSEDWMHVLFANGVWNTEAYLLLDRLSQTRVSSISATHAYLQAWVTPGAYSTKDVHGRDALTPANWKASREKDTPSLRTYASEGLSIYPILQAYVEGLPAGDEAVHHAVRSYLLLCQVIDMIRNVESGFVSADALDLVLDDHMRAFCQAHGEDWVQPKAHWLLHFGDTLRQFGTLLNCWVHERKHRVAKRFGNYATNTSKNWEGDILGEISNFHYDQLLKEDALGAQRCFLQHRQASEMLSKWFARHGVAGDVQTSSRARLSSGRVCVVNDVICVVEDGRARIGKALLFAGPSGT